MEHIKQASERLLMRIIRKNKANEETDLAFEVLRERLRRGFFYALDRIDGGFALIPYEEEIVSSVVTSLWNKYPTITGNSRQYRKFIRTTIYRTCIARLIKEAKTSVSLDDFVSSSSDSNDVHTLLDDLASGDRGRIRLSEDWKEAYGDDPSSSSPEEFVIHNESYLDEIIEEAKTLLSDRCQKIFGLIVQGNLSQGEMAIQLEMKPNTVRVQILRCRHKLRRASIELLAQKNTNHDSIYACVDQLPTQHKIVFLAWWEQGITSWAQLGRVANVSADRAKMLLAQATATIFEHMQ